MDTQSIDERLRGVYERSAPAVDEAAFRARLRRSTGRRPSKAFVLVHPRRRLVLAALSTVVILAALGFGVSTLVERLGRDQSVVIITDDSMSPGASGAAGGEVSSVGEDSLRYGEILRFEELEIAITVAPQPVPLVTPPEPDPPLWAAKRVRSQLIMTNIGDKSYDFIPADVRILDATGERYISVGAESQLPMAVEAGVTVTMVLDWYLGANVEVANVVYTPTGVPTGESGQSFRWGPEAITEGPGYPVLQTLPPLRYEDVTSIDLQRTDPGGGQPSVETFSPDVADLRTLIEYYEQTTLVPSEGYPGFGSPVQITFHLKDGGALVIGIGSADEDHIVIKTTRAGGAGNPPAAVGVNRALVDAHYKGISSGPVTTSGVAPTSDDPPLSSTTTTMGVGPRFAWGEEAVLDGRTITVEQPVEVPGETVELPDSRGVRVYVTAYSLVTITNTGSEPLTCAAGEFFLMGKSSGSSGIGGPHKTPAGEEVLDVVTLQPGESVRAAVRFQLVQGDHPVKVLLGTRDSTTGSIHSSTSEWLALWQ